MVYVTHNAFWKAKWWPIDPDLLLIRALSTAVVAHAVAPKENKDVPVIDQVAFAAVQPPPFSSIDQPHPSPDGVSLSLSPSL